MKLAWKELTHSWKKYTLITLIVVLMMFMVLFLSGLVDGLGRAVSSGIDNMPAQSFVLKDDAEGLITVSSITKDQANAVSAQAQHETATIDISRMYVSKSGSDEKIDVTYFAIDPAGTLAPGVLEGSSLADSDSQNAIILDDDFMAKGISVGDVIRDSSTSLEFTVVGFTKDAMYSHISIGYISTETYANLMHELNPNYRDSIHAIALSDSAEAISVDGLTVMSKADVINKIPGYASEQMTIKMVDWMLVVITAVILAIFFFVINLQKEKEFGVMKAIGISMGRLSRFVIAEVGIIATSGACIAGILVWGMAQGLPATMPFYLKTQNVLVILIAFILISLAGSLISIIKVGRIDPAEIIGGDN